MRERLMRIGLAILAATSVPLAFWATFAPRQFYDSFPGGGRHWIAIDGPYNQHLVRDVGALSLALFIIAVWALVTVSIPLVRATAVAYLVDGALHLGYHVRHLAPYDTVDQIGMVAGLVLAPAAALLVLVASTRRPTFVPTRPASPAPATPS